MKFYQGLLPRIIWDPSKNTALLEFDDNGVFETDDENLIKLLRGKGYLLDMDMAELERTGRLPHGGFEKVGEENLPSGRPAVEDDTHIHGQKPLVRARQMPATEAADVGTTREEPVMNVRDEEVVPVRTRKKPTTVKKSKRKIRRRKK